MLLSLVAFTLGVALAQEPAEVPAVEAPVAEAPVAEAPPAAVVVTEADFGCLQQWPQVGRTRFTNVAGDTDAALAVARGEAPGPYPPGTVVQLAPNEAMVKLAPGADPATDDWEYLKLAVSRRGEVTITERGGVEMKNVAGGCAECHSGAKDHDSVCMQGHGCEPLPGFVVNAALRAVRNDPRCRVP